MPILLGIDIGTTGAKCLAINEEGKVIASAYRGYKLIFPGRDRVEQNPEDWWEALKMTIGEVLQTEGIKDEIVGLSLSTQGGTSVLLDEQDRSLGNAVTWLDRRNTEGCEKLVEEYGMDFFYRKTGWKLAGFLSLAQLHWFKENETELLTKARHIVFVNDYIIHRLTGRYINDPSNSGVTMLYNIKEGKWDEELLEIVGISEEQLSSVQESGTPIETLTEEASKELGLPQKVEVISGGHDQYCAALGVGAISPGDILLSCGTAWVILGVYDKLILDNESHFTPGRHIVKDRWGMLSSILTGGAALKWFIDNLVRESYSKLEKEVSKVPLGANDLLFLPHLEGSTVPTWSSQTRGVLLGLELSHNKYDIVRSIMEGVGFEVLWNIEAMRKLGMKIEKLKLIGGAAQSPLWSQIIADITGLSVSLPEVHEAACLGAAILAGVGVGIFPDAESGLRRLMIEDKTIDHNLDNKEKYRSLFDIYKEAFYNLQPIFTKLKRKDMRDIK